MNVTTFNSRSGRAWLVSLTVLAMIAVLAVSLAPGTSTAGADGGGDGTTATGADARRLLAALAIDDESLAYAGCTAAETAAIVTAAAQYDGSDILMDAANRQREAEREVERLSDRVRSGGASAATIQQLTDARGDLRSARAAASAARESAFAATVDGIAAEKASRLRRLTAVDDDVLPAAFALADLDEAARLRVRDAYLHVQQKQRSGDDAAPDATAIVDAARSQPAVAAALAAHAANAGAVADAWRSELDGSGG